MHEPGALIATGRDADIFDYEPRAVLRRSRNGRSAAPEAATMELVRAAGYPVPEVFEVSEDGCDLVMERIDGPTMVDAAAARPWLVRRYGAMLAELHDQLHHIDAPKEMASAPFGSGTSMLHLDLHPLNVLMSPRGPVVIDWTNAARGDPAADVALTSVLLAVGDLHAGRAMSLVIALARSQMLRSFLSRVGTAVPDPLLDEAITYKCSDPNMSESEIAQMRALRPTERA